MKQLESSEATIQRNIPIPPKAVGRPKGSGKYSKLLQQMKLGDSILIGSISARAAMFSAAKALKMSIVSRREGKSYRVWRNK